MHLLRSLQRRLRDAWASRRRGPREWILQAVEADIRRALSRDQTVVARVWAGLRAQASEPGQVGSWRLLVGIAVYFGGLLVLALVLSATNPTFLPDWRPFPGPDGIFTTWQVLAALVAAALPFLFVLLPLVKDEALAVTRTAQVLMADTMIYPILAFGLGGTIWTGAAALWLSSDGSVWIAFNLVLVPTAVGVGFAYFAAGRIISDPQHVRKQSMRLLLEIMDDALIEQQSRAYANGDLVELLEAKGIQKSELFVEPDDATPVPALREGQLRDIDRNGLQAWLDELAQTVPTVPSAAFQTAEIEPEQIVSSDDRRGWWRPLLGDRIQTGQPIVLLPAAAREAVDPDEVAITLDRCLKLERHA